jgi:hypothetical protein
VQECVLFLDVETVVACDFKCDGSLTVLLGGQLQTVSVVFDNRKSGASQGQTAVCSVGQ